MTNSKSFTRAVLRFLCLTTALNCQPSCALFAGKTPYSEELGQRLVATNELFGGQSLQAKHYELVAREQCEPVAFYLIGRHAGRNADEDTIIDMNERLKEFVESMMSSTTSSSERASKYQSWTPRFEPSEGNLVNKHGAIAHRKLAERFKQIYPMFFNAKTANVDLACTTKVRTTQSGIEFMKAVDGFELNVDDPDCSKAPNYYNYDKLLGGGEKKCLNSARDGHSKKELTEAHKICKKELEVKAGGKKLKKQATRDKDGILDRIKGLKRKLFERIANRIHRELGLDAVPDVKTITSVYDGCQYETSAFGESTWCDLFTSKDLEAIEYLDDAGSYHKIAACDQYALKVQSAPLFKDILSRFNDQTTNDEPSSRRPMAAFRFNHSGLMRKILAVLGLFEPDMIKGYTIEELDVFEETGKIPSSRLWRASLMLPFSGNVGFTLYKCADDQFKVLTTISEQPVRVHGCEDAACSLKKFTSTYGWMNKIELPQICKQVRVILGLSEDELNDELNHELNDGLNSD
uniref:Multiple inositol polyphosphate phosphatase 1 n=1 Tax=Aceria tosichella TaxID=561515 RepID=A0A6G1S515_9ACAR